MCNMHAQTHRTCNTGGVGGVGGVGGGGGAFTHAERRDEGDARDTPLPAKRPRLNPPPQDLKKSREPLNTAPDTLMIKSVS